MASAFVIQLKPGSDRTEEGIRRHRVFISWRRMGPAASRSGITYAELRGIVRRAGLGKYELGQYANFVLRMGRGSRVFVPCNGDRYIEGIVLSRRARYGADLGHWREVRWLHGERKLPRAGLPRQLQRTMKLNRTCTRYDGPLPGAAKSAGGGASAGKVGGGGWRNKPNAAENRAIERRAVAVAKRFYKDLGYQVETKGKPYDLLCRNGGRPLYVEVKGTQGDAREVVLTANEVKHFREKYPHTALLVVAGIRLTGKPPVGRGGEEREIAPWRPRHADLRATQYDYAVPPPLAK